MSPMVSTNDLKNGMTLEIDGVLFSVVEFQHVKPGKGGAFVRSKIRNLKTGAVLDRTWRADEKIEQAIVEKKDMQYLYRNGNQYVFMDSSSYDQIEVDASSLGSAVNYFVEGSNVQLVMHVNDVVSVELPASVELVITESEPGVQGDRVSGARKPATLETGLTVQVPLFVNQGDKVKIDTRTGEYITRA